MGKTMHINLKETKCVLSKACLICGEGIILTENEKEALYCGYHIDNKVCDKCKQAILYIRKQMEENNHDS